MADGVSQKPIAYQLKLESGLLRDCRNSLKKNRNNIKNHLGNVNSKKDLDYTNYIE